MGMAQDWREYEPVQHEPQRHRLYMLQQRPDQLLHFLHHPLGSGKVLATAAFIALLPHLPASTISVILRREVLQLAFS